MNSALQAQEGDCLLVLGILNHHQHHRLSGMGVDGWTSSRGDFFFFRCFPCLPLGGRAGRLLVAPFYLCAVIDCWKLVILIIHLFFFSGVPRRAYVRVGELGVGEVRLACISNWPVFSLCCPSHLFRGHGTSGCVIYYYPHSDDSLLAVSQGVGRGRDKTHGQEMS